MWLNGWCTTRRFQQAATRCCASPYCDGRDELEHYAVCPHFRRCAAHFLQISFRPASLANFLGVSGEWTVHPALIAVHMYVTRAVVHRHHLQGIHAELDADLHFLYRERLRHLASSDSSLRRLIPRL